MVFKEKMRVQGKRILSTAPRRRTPTTGQNTADVKNVAVDPCAPHLHSYHGRSGHGRCRRAGGVAGRRAQSLLEIAASWIRV